MARTRKVQIARQIVDVPSNEIVPANYDFEEAFAEAEGSFEAGDIDDARAHLANARDVMSTTAQNKRYVALRRRIEAGQPEATASKTPLASTPAPVLPSSSKSRSKPKTNSKETKMATKSKRAAARKSIAKAATRKEPQNSCLCGCGAKTHNLFAMGHDARLKGMLARGEVKRPSGDQLAFAKKHGIKLGSAAKATKEPKRTKAAAA